MKKVSTIFFVIISSFLYSISAFAISIDEKINEIFNPISSLVVSIVFFSIEIMDDTKIPIIVVWLIIAAIFCTLYFGFVNVRHLSLIHI